MHGVPCGVVGLHRQECAGADVQGDFRNTDAALLQAGQQLFGEMQARGWCRHRAFFLGEKSLVIGAVLFVRLTAGGDIRRQGHLAPLGNRLIQDRPMEGK